jgi:hypothetical protein
MKKPKTVTRNEPHIRPDIDKLVRAVLDGLTDVVYRDDEQVTSLTAVKQYGEQEGVWIRITDRGKLGNIRSLPIGLVVSNINAKISNTLNDYSD